MAISDDCEALSEQQSDKKPTITEDALALEFSKLHGAELRYVAQWGKWLQWTGERWLFENTLRVFDLARSLAREFAAITKIQKIARALPD